MPNLLHSTCWKLILGLNKWCARRACCRSCLPLVHWYQGNNINEAFSIFAIHWFKVVLFLTNTTYSENTTSKNQQHEYWCHKPHDHFGIDPYNSRGAVVFLISRYICAVNRVKFSFKHIHNAKHVSCERWQVCKCVTELSKSPVQRNDLKLVRVTPQWFVMDLKPHHKTLWNLAMVDIALQWVMFQN